MKFLQTLIKHPKVIEWDFDTNFIFKNQKDLLNFPVETCSKDILSTVICHILHNKQKYNKVYDQQNPWFTLDNFRVNHKSHSKFKLFNSSEKLDDHNKPTNTFDVDLKYLNENSFSVTIENKGHKTNYDSVIGKIIGENQVEIHIKHDSIFKVQVL